MKEGVDAIVALWVTFQNSQLRIEEDKLKLSNFRIKQKADELELLANLPIISNTLANLVKNVDWIFKVMFRSAEIDENFKKALIQLLSGEVTDKSVFEAMGVKTKNIPALSKHIETLLKQEDTSIFLGKLFSGGFDSGDGDLIGRYTPTLSANELNQLKKAFVVESQETGNKYGLSELILMLLNGIGNLQQKI